MTDAPAPLRLLLIAPANLPRDDLRRVLAEAFAVQIHAVASATGLRTALEQPDWDIALFHSGVASFKLATALELIDERQLDLPLILLTAGDDSSAAPTALPAGVRDALSSTRLAHLPAMIARELRDASQRAEHRAALEMLRLSEARFRAMATNLPGMLFHLRRDINGDYRFHYVSEGCQKLIGRKQQELLGSARLFFEAFDNDARHRLHEALNQSAQQGTMLNWEGRTSGRARPKWLNLRSQPQALEGGGVEWQGIATNISESKQSQEELRQSRQHLAELSSHLEAVKEDERARIAGDIHDELGSLLVRMKIEIGLLADKLPDNLAPLRSKAQSIKELLDQAMGTVSRVTRELRPGILKEFGLAEALRYQAEDFEQRAGIVCRMQCDDEGIAPDDDTALAIFRIAQEALTNVAKHAHASLAAMRLWRENGNILFEIRDNGRGIAPADMSKPRSFGLRGIRERIHNLKGDISIEPGEHEGTLIRLRVPEHAEAEPVVEDQPQRSLF